MLNFMNKVYNGRFAPEFRVSMLKGTIASSYSFGKIQNIRDSELSDKKVVKLVFHYCINYIRTLFSIYLLNRIYCIL